jgi:hypothetical protein
MTLITYTNLKDAKIKGAYNLNDHLNVYECKMYAKLKRMSITYESINSY